MKELLIAILDFFGLACWLEVVTEAPRCTYYFGPFLHKKDAMTAKEGYLEDLENEGSFGISVKIRRFKPNNLTIFDEVEAQAALQRITTLRSQPSL